MNSRNSRTAIAVMTICMAAGTTAPALASGGGGVQRQGACSMASTWALKAKADNGRLEVEGQVDSNVVGQHWAWRILHNGAVAARGSATTTAPSGSFSVQRSVANSNGVDHIGWRASNAATGEQCSGGLSL
jgi:hypothetical protein